MNEIMIRELNRGNSAQVEKLGQMAQAAQIEERALEGDLDAEKWARQAAECVESSLADDRDYYFVLADGDELLGYILYVYDNKKELGAGWIYDLYIKQEYRGNSLALELMRAAEEMAISQGANKLRIFTHKSNIATQKTAKRFGFIEVPELEEPEKYINYEKKIGWLRPYDS